MFVIPANEIGIWWELRLVAIQSRQSLLECLLQLSHISHRVITTYL